MTDGPAAWPTTAQPDVVLRSGDAGLAVDLRGGGLRRLVVGEWDVLDGYPAGAVPEGARGAVLIPWPNRLRHGRWTWEGRQLQLDVASPDEPHALHGLVRSQPWALLDTADDRATVATTLAPHPGYPFRLDAAVDYALTGERLAVTVRVRNSGSHEAPFGAGMHPYLHVGAAQDGGISAGELTVGARTALDTDAGLPTGERHRFHGDVGRIGSRSLDVPLTDLERDADGWAHVRLRGPAGTVELAVDQAWPWLQVYTGDQLPEGQHRRSLAVEPMTCPANALADGVDLVVLAPGAEWSGTWTLSWTPSADS